MSYATKRRKDSTREWLRVGQRRGTPIAMQEICNTAALPLDTNPLVRKIKCEEFPAIRGKQHTRVGMGVRDEMEEEFAVKTRNTPPMGPAPGQEHPRMEHGGNGFWLAAVTTAGAPHPMLETCTETGFINSQPSMAEFMTALPQLGGGELSPQHTPPGYAPDLPSPGGGLNVPEYPWMKEKKTTRKSSQQGMCYSKNKLNSAEW